MTPATGTLDEAYERLHATGPEFDGSLSNHGPRAAEALVRHGHGDLVTSWLDEYMLRLEEFPRGTGPIGADWQQALGDPRRIADWTVFFGRELGEQPWRAVLPAGERPAQSMRNPCNDVPVEIEEHIACLRHAGDLLAEAAERTDLDAPVPTCPGWQMRDLLRHTGDVHRWATRYVAGQVGKTRRASEAELLRDGPADASLTEWFREGHARLVAALAGAAPDLECWTFLEAPSPLAFWARRQAHETTIHSVDAQVAAGAAGEARDSLDRMPPADPIPPALAADGIDELLMGFGRQGNGDAPLSGLTLSLAIRATAGGSARASGAGPPEGGDWLVRMRTDRVEPFDFSRGLAGDDGDIDCVVTGSASGIYLMLWNRRGADGIDVRGDASLLDALRRELRVT